MKTVYVGLSGGVDSSVTAALLQQRGYRVVGVYMKNWTRAIGGAECPWKADLADARDVAAHLEIPFKVYDFEAGYKSRVVDYMVAEYRAGRTPNPDIMCNQEIKFKLFLQAAVADGADLIATGHYARVRDGRLLAGIDPNKDQSYFLARVTGEALQRSLMPIGELTKPAVRRLAREFGLPTAAKKDSQGICFVGQVKIKDFLKQYIGARPGDVVRLPDRSVIGRHDGAVFYTLGQRHGLGIGGGTPYYVIAKDIDANIVYVTERGSEATLKSDHFALSDIHWINQPPAAGQPLQVRTRYRGPLIGCRLSPEPPERSPELVEGLAVTLDRPERAVTPGQSAVIYAGSEVIGSGIIAAARPAVVHV